jgi:2-oxoglutarate dehydrogenase complex dehydrogenase (E1) component-like enzyme
MPEENNMFQETLSSSYLSGANAAFVEELYEQYLRDPASGEGQGRT